MRKQSWANTVIRGAAAAAIAAATLAPMQAYASDQRVPPAGGYRVVSFGAPEEPWRTNDPDPTDDGSIIIECIVFDGHGATGARAQTRGLIGVVAVPEFPLGPSRCWPREYQRT